MCARRWCVCVCVSTTHVFICLQVCKRLWMDECVIVTYENVCWTSGWNTAPECLLKWTQTSISGRPLVFPALEGDTVVVTHMLLPGCICGLLMRHGILILSGCLLCVIFFNYLFSLLFKCYANEAYACVCMCVSQGCVNAVLDTSTCLMDATSLDMVIIMDTQEQRDLTLSQ